MDRTYPEDWSFVESNCYQIMSAVYMTVLMHCHIGEVCCPVFMGSTIRFHTEEHVQHHVWNCLLETLSFIERIMCPVLSSISSACAKEILSLVNHNCTDPSGSWMLVYSVEYVVFPSATLDGLGYLRRPKALHLLDGHRKYTPGIKKQ